MLQLKDPELISFADFLINGNAPARIEKANQELTQEIYVERDSESVFVAIFEVLSGSFRYYYKRTNNLTRFFQYELIEMERDGEPFGRENK